MNYKDNEAKLLQKYKKQVIKNQLSNDRINQEINKLQIQLSKKQTTLTILTQNINQIISKYIVNIDIHILLLICEYLMEENEILNLYLVNKFFKNLIETEFDYFITILYTENKITYTNYIPKDIFRENNLSFEQFFYIIIKETRIVGPTTSILHNLCYINNLNIIKYLCNKYKDFNMDINKLFGPIYQAIHKKQQNFEIIKFLISYGIEYKCDVNFSDNPDITYSNIIAYIMKIQYDNRRSDTAPTEIINIIEKITDRLCNKIEYTRTEINTEKLIENDIIMNLYNNFTIKLQEYHELAIIGK